MAMLTTRELAAVENQLRLENMLQRKYREAAKTGALGDACVGCGTCEAQCPQHLPISQWMPKIHQLLG